jgi:hypothetical protein
MFSDLEAARGPDGVHVRARLGSPAEAVVLWRAEGSDFGRAEVFHRAASLPAGAWEHVDRSARPEMSYTYRIEMSAGGERVESVPLFVPESGAHGIRLQLASRSPGPGPLKLSFALAGPGVVQLDVYDVAGRLVRRLHRGPVAGSQVLEWDGFDAAGAPAAPGLYFVRLESGGQTAATRFVRTR